MALMFLIGAVVVIAVMTKVIDKLLMNRDTRLNDESDMP